jgi:hypothetical protein
LYQEDHEAIGERAGRHPAYPHYRSATTSSRVIPRPYRPVPCSLVFYASNLVALGRSIAFVFRHVSVSTLDPSCDGILCGRSLIGGRNVAHSKFITEVGRGAHCNGIQPSGLLSSGLTSNRCDSAGLHSYPHGGVFDRTNDVEFHMTVKNDNTPSRS